MKKREILSRVFFWGIVLVLIGSLLVAVFSDKIEGIIQGDSPSASTFQSVSDAENENSQLLEVTLVDEDVLVQSNSEFEINVTNISDKKVGSIKIIPIIQSEISLRLSPDIVRPPQELFTILESQEVQIILGANETITVPVKFDFGLEDANMLFITAQGVFLVDGSLPENDKPYYLKGLVGGYLEIPLSP